MTKPILTSRRRFMAGTGSFLALSTVPSYLKVEQLTVLKSQFSLLSNQQGVVVFKQGDKHSIEFASVFADTGMPVIELGIDPVRQWRDGLSEVMTDKKLPIIGMTNWSDYLLMRGLAAEVRRFPVVETQHKANPLNKDCWANAHALELLELLESQSLENIQEILAKPESSNSVNGKSLFSWVLA